MLYKLKNYSYGILTILFYEFPLFIIKIKIKIKIEKYWNIYIYIYV